MISRARRNKALVAGLALLSLGAEVSRAEDPVQPDAHEALKQLAAEVYVYAYPLVLLDVMRAVMTDTSSGDPGKAAVNRFAHRRDFPDAGPGGGASPDVDTLWSSAWIDLAEEPVVLSVPATGNRYYSISMLDAWTHALSPFGTRTTGNEKGDFALVGPGFAGALPQGVTEIRSATNRIWMIGRIETRGKVDVRWVKKLQDQLRLTPLSGFGKKREATARPIPAAARVDSKTPPVEQVARMDAQGFFSRLALTLPGNPPAPADAPLVEKMGALGVVAGQPFDVTKLDPETQKAIEDGARAGLESIAAAARQQAGEEKNGWTLHTDRGPFGLDYTRRAVRAYSGPRGESLEDVFDPSTRVDAGGRPLSGANAYVLHFDKGQIPPAEAFWSLTMYGDRQSFVANPLDRYALGDRDKLRYNPGGSLDVYIQSTSPGKERESNWLPAPRGAFSLTLRLYRPKPPAPAGGWRPPAVQRVR